ncbi:MAG: thioester reductase domain protein [Gammaproteobacteria bacterium]|jgi:thioester reductase-like protein|nr:thioester reductase domain protein [Gammaproteobacteria bacterium]
MNSNKNGIFLTGMTGVLGAKLLAELLTSTKSPIYCLVRAKNEQLAMERIEKFLSVYDPHKLLYSEMKSRVIPVIGDLTKSYLGLNLSIYKELKGKVSLVIHAAANVSLFGSYDPFKMVNVEGTDRVIKLCEALDAKLTYISSYSIFGRKLFEEGVVFKESDLDVGQSFDDMEYSRSKFEAEGLVHQAAKKGLPCWIFRPGNIFGDSSSGYYPLTVTNVGGLYYQTFKTLIETGLSPFLNRHAYDMTPVDYVAKAIVAISLNSPTYNRTFHLLNPHTMVFSKITNLLVEYGYRIRFVDLHEYNDLFRKNRVLREGKVYQSSFTSFFTTFKEEDLDLFQKARFDTSFTQKSLKEFNIVCPPADINLLRTYLDYCVKQGYISSPEDEKVLAKIIE